MRVRALVGIGAVVLLAACDSTPKARSETTVEVSRAVCGSGWSDPHGGTQVFRVHNVGTNTAEVELVDPATGAVYAEVDGVAPGTTRPMQVRLGRGRYAFKCLPEDTDALTGSTVTVRDGPARGAPAVVPVGEQDLRDAVTTYRAYVTRSFGPLRRDVAALEREVRSGDRAAARRAWLTAHLDYERLGAAYGTFGDLADAIDRLPAGLPDGAHDKDFTGFHRIEYGLWHGESMTALRGPAGRLRTDVGTLVGGFDREQTDPNDLPLRAHEILEATLEFELTGAADQGSGSTLATARANVDGTRAVLSALRPVLTGRYRGLSGADASLDTLAKLLDAQHSGGTWTPVADLSRAERERLDGATGDALERLAPIAALAEVRRTR
ncbi:EfeM/EfeO family lipoprotein [Actinocatenispora rupis]|uniref:Iron transporter n=1 Tax=Actinocatenispora rupis TaxID=519421 RepID=A0A8J3ITE2_9ACTN|nr:EfeM/EfeO family lipoprotein [Actinocatenispora rupis]GID09581.1 iron transporter [Actinocatenispora rupis]